MLHALYACDEEDGGGAAGIALAPSAVRHPNTGLVAPLWQGDGCAGLSGLYACLNGVRLTLAHKRQLTCPELDALMRAGLRFLDGRLTPQQCVVNGLRVQLWRRLVAAVLEAAYYRLGTRILLEPVPCPHIGDREAAFDALQQAVSTFRVPLLLCRGGHFTAVCGVTPASLILFDSHGAWSVRRQACGVRGDGEALRHVIYPSSFLAMNV